MPENDLSPMGATTITHRRHRTDHGPYDRDRRMEQRVTFAAIAGLTVVATVWASLGSVGQALVVAAAFVGALWTLWEKLVRPIIHTVTEASEAYKTLTSVDEKLDGALSRFTAIEDRVADLERVVAWMRRRVGTRDEDHPDRQG